MHLLGVRLPRYEFLFQPFADGGGFGTQEPDRWESFVQWMKDNGMIDQSLDASAAYRADIGE